jgi:hypothetical protein
MSANEWQEFLGKKGGESRPFFVHPMKVLPHGRDKVFTASITLARELYKKNLWRHSKKVLDSSFIST